MKTFLVIYVATFLLLLTACSKAPEPPPIAEATPPQIIYEQIPQPVQQQPQIVYAQQPQQPVVVQQSSHDGLLTGMVIGHMMSGGSSGGSSNRTTVNKTVVVNKTYSRPSSSRSYSSSRRK